MVVGKLLSYGVFSLLLSTSTGFMGQPNGLSLRRRPSSRCLLCQRKCLTAPGIASRRRKRAEPCMVLEQLDPGSRSELKGRTYATDPNLFSRLDSLNNCAAWKDPLVFSDKTNAPFASLPVLLKEMLEFGLMFAAAYAFFPLLCHIISPVMNVSDVAVTDRVRAGLTGSFLPGISLLFGTLFSYTISLLVNRQTRIEELVNQELANLNMLLWHVIDFYQQDERKLTHALKEVWRHTDKLIYSSRYEEILSMVQEDPIENLIRYIIRTSDDDLSDEGLGKPNINRDVIGYMRNLCTEINKLRSMRLSSEGRTLPPVHFAILGTLAIILLFGFTLTSLQSPGWGEGSELVVPRESRVLFSLLVNAFFLLLEFATDLTNPYTGRYRIRRTTTTASLIKIRNDIVQTLGAQAVQRFSTELRLSEKNIMTRFSKLTGEEIPHDRHIQ